MNKIIQKIWSKAMKIILAGMACYQKDQRDFQILFGQLIFLNRKIFIFGTLTELNIQT